MKMQPIARAFLIMLLGCLLSACRTPDKGHQVMPTDPVEWTGGGSCRVRGKYYELPLTSDRLRKTPAWNVNKCENPPVLPGKALALARKELAKTFQDASRWGIERIWIQQSFAIPGIVNDLWDRWYYELAFTPPEAKPIDGSLDSFDFLVLMDGTVIAPQEIITSTNEPDGSANDSKPLPRE
jgi:hypothetical protein